MSGTSTRTLILASLGVGLIALASWAGGRKAEAPMTSWVGQPGGSPTATVADTTASTGGVTIAMRPRFDRGEVYLETDKPLYLSTEIEVVGGTKPDRKPLALALVLDVSGSMSGERKLEHVVEATQYVVDRLGERDRVAIVAYDSDRHEVYLPAGRVDPDAARRALAKLRPGSGTNMEIGIRLGLDKLAKLGGDGHVKRLLVLSDGQANEGVHDIDGLARIAAGAREQEASVSTFGVGAGYNEDLMAAIAERAGGNYYVIDRGAELAEVFRKEFDELGSTVGTQVTLAVRPPAGLEVVEAFGYPGKQVDGASVYTLRDLFHGQKTKVMLKLARVDGPKPKPGSEDAVDLEMRWVDATTGEERLADFQARFRWSAFPEAEEESIDTAVTELAQEVESARVLDRASREYEKGNAAEAKRLLKSQMQLNLDVARDKLGESAARLEAQNRMFEDAIGQFDEAPASSRSGKAAVKMLKQGARMSAY